MPELYKEPVTSGVYRIKNRVTGKSYIGSAKAFRHRWNQHRRALNAGAHHSVHLQRAWDKYKTVCFVFMVIEECALENCVAREQHYLDLEKTYVDELGYNCCPTAGSQLGYKQSKEAVEKRAKSNRGKKRSKEVCDRISAGKMGTIRGPMPAEHKAKLVVANLGRRRGKETKDKISAKVKAQWKAARAAGRKHL